METASRISTFYRFIPITNPTKLKKVLERHLADTELLGTVLLASEGVNGMISGARVQVVEFLDFLSRQLGIDELSFSVAYAQDQPFHRMKVRLKKEIVTLGVEGINPRKKVGTYVPPSAWNELIQQEGIVLVDARNEYEYTVGTFKGAENPVTKSFREFPEYVDRNLDPVKHPKVAMFCTGGIRCEKATALLMQKGFKEVYHLQGGILEYLSQIPENQSLWEGECFVFDERVTVDQNLEKGSYEMCHACRMPLSVEDRQSEFYQKGIGCPHCYDKITEEKRLRLEQRNRQMQLAKERNQRHPGQKQNHHRSVDSDESE